MVRIEIGAGTVLAALGALGFLVHPVVAWMLLAFGIALMVHGGLEIMKLRLRWPFYFKTTAASADRIETSVVKGNTQISSQEMRTLSLADAMQRIGTDDSNNLSVRVVAFVNRVEPHLLAKEKRPYIDFMFDVVNASILPVSMGSQCEGLIKMDKTPLTQRCEVRGSDGNILHGETRPITVRQYCSDQDAQEEVAWNPSDTIPFDFRELNTWMTANWLGFKNEKARLKLGNHVSLGDYVWLSTAGLMR